MLALKETPERFNKQGLLCIKGISQHIIIIIRIRLGEYNLRSKRHIRFLIIWYIKYKDLKSNKIYLLIDLCLSDFGGNSYIASHII